MPALATNPLAGRVTIVLAAAGYGKTRAVRAWLGATRATWHNGTDLTGGMAARDGDRVTVVDDLHLASADTLAAWLAPALAAGSRLILLTRSPVPRAVLRSFPRRPPRWGPPCSR